MLLGPTSRLISVDTETISFLAIAGTCWEMKRSYLETDCRSPAGRRVSCLSETLLDFFPFHIFFFWPEGMQST